MNFALKPVIPMACALVFCALHCCAVQAQSSVSMYGRLDIATRYTSDTGSGGLHQQKWALTDGATSSSRLGFRGSEDLGGGLRALFVLEMGINPDTGALAQGGRGFGRLSYVGLDTGYGVVTLGRQYSPIYMVEGANDPFGPYNAYEPGFIYDNYTGTAVASSGANRWDNAVQYAFASGGLSVSAIVSAGEGEVGKGSVGRKEGASLGYASGPYSVSAGWQQTHDGSGIKDHKVWTVGGTWKLEPVTLNLSYLDHKSDLVKQTNKVWAIGGTWSVTPLFDLVVGYYLDRQHEPVGNKRLLAIMGNYRLSKRTNVYLQGDQARIRGGYAQNVFDAYRWPSGIDKRTTVTAGIRHVF